MSTALHAGPLRAALAVVALCLAAPAQADAPLPPAARTVTEVRGGTVTTDPDLGTTVIRTAGRPGWTVPGWHRFWALSPSGDDFLAVQADGNLIGSTAPETLAFTVYSRNGCPAGPILLGHLPGAGADLPRTASHFQLYASILWDEVAVAWRITLGSGNDVLIHPPACPEPAVGG